MSRRNSTMSTTTLQKQTHVETKEPQLPGEDEFMNAEETDAFRDNILTSARIPGSSSNFKKNRLVLRYWLIDGYVVKAMPQLVQLSILRLAEHSTFAGHPRKRRMNVTSKCAYYWLSRSTNVHNIVPNIDFCSEIGTGVK